MIEEWVTEISKLTVRLRIGTTWQEMVGDDNKIKKSGVLLRKGIRRLRRLEVPLLVLLLLDDAEDNTLLLDRFLELEMVPIDGTAMNTGEILRLFVESKES
jgi:hypothetical protein